MASRVIFSPLRSKRDRISPTSPRATASGLTIIKVFSHSLIVSGRRPDGREAAAPTSLLSLNRMATGSRGAGLVPGSSLIRARRLCRASPSRLYRSPARRIRAGRAVVGRRPSAPEGPGRLPGEVGQDDVRARPLHGGEHLQDDRLLVDPARQGSGLHKGVLAAHVV